MPDIVASDKAFDSEPPWCRQENLPMKHHFEGFLDHSNGCGSSVWTGIGFAQKYGLHIWSRKNSDFILSHY